MTANLDNYPWLEVVHPEARLGGVRYALFDFDGTISVIRQGWEKIMAQVMVESICGEFLPTSGDNAPYGRSPRCHPEKVMNEVAEYIDRSTGILTIVQMKWLVETVRRYGIEEVRTASEYKRIYTERLLMPVYERLGRIGGEHAERGNQRDNAERCHEMDQRDEFMMKGARKFLEELRGRGVELLLASGTDEEYVRNEAGALGVAELFLPHIYGAQGDSETDSKELVIQRILEENRLQGEELVVVGDGPVEIRYARQVGALALGVASDEVQRSGLNPRKRRRLLEAGADYVVADFEEAGKLAEVLTRVASSPQDEFSRGS
jgi:phosphoglycolate phosphatase-like HAD superfamily hydrolase